ncbi:MAG: hypothetical protein EON54_14810 [Alcaligenaceae bacterium]|nr:MAG: hypothetical protein EON54_14810 [Alcaligenaceae bacterium]
MSAEHDPQMGQQEPLDEDRRKFLAACGKFAVVTPPALTVLLSTSLNSEAVAKSGGGRDGPPRGGGGRGRDRDFLEWLEKLLSKFF